MRIEFWKELTSTFRSYIMNLVETHAFVGLRCRSLSLSLYSAASNGYRHSKLQEHLMDTANFFDGCAPVFHIEFTGSLWPYLSDIAALLAEDFQLKSIQRLYVDGSLNDARHDQWTRIVSLFPRVEHLYDPRGCCLQADDFTACGTHLDTLTPHLQTFWTSVHILKYTEETVQNKTIHDWLRLRSNRGDPLSRLCLVHSPDSPQDQGVSPDTGFYDTTLYFVQEVSPGTELIIYDDASGRGRTEQLLFRS